MLKQKQICVNEHLKSSKVFPRQIIEDEMLWRELVDRYSDYFEGGMGADAIAQLVERLDFDEEEIKLRKLLIHQQGKSPCQRKENKKQSRG